MSDTPRLSLIVPAFQEGATIVASLNVIRTAAAETGLPFQLIVVDDGSTDRTWEELQRGRSAMPELLAVRLSRNFGKEGAISAGLDHATGDACIILDADLQHPPSLIPQMVRLWQSDGWDVVEGVKSNRGKESISHRLITRTFYRVAGWMTGYNLQDASDFKLMDRRVVEEWRRFGERITFFRGLIAWLGFKRTQILFEVPPRQGGRSRWSQTGLMSLAVHAVTSFSAVPLQIVTVLGLAMLVIATALGFQALRLWYSGTAMPGVTTVILLQLIIGGFLMISLGVIGTYISRIYDEVKGRPRYVVRDILKP
jgi:dolichol-phosphate mannosyltransferase